LNKTKNFDHNYSKERRRVVMEEKKKVEQNWDEEQRGTSKYGDFVPSYFCWNTQEEQREKTEWLGSITDEKKSKKKK